MGTCTAPRKSPTPATLKQMWTPAKLYVRMRISAMQLLWEKIVSHMWAVSWEPRYRAGELDLTLCSIDGLDGCLDNRGFNYYELDTSSTTDTTDTSSTTDIADTSSTTVSTPDNLNSYVQAINNSCALSLCMIACSRPLTFSYAQAIDNFTEPKSLHITVTATNDAFIFFSTGGEPSTTNGYQIALGGWGNQKSMLRIGVGSDLGVCTSTTCGGLDGPPEHDTPDLLNTDGSTDFTVEKTERRLTVKKDDGTELFSIPSVQCSEVWVKTGNGATGEWSFVEEALEEAATAGSRFHGIRLQANANNDGFVDYTQCEDGMVQRACGETVGNRNASRSMFQPRVGPCECSAQHDAHDPWGLLCHESKRNSAPYLCSSTEVLVTPPGSAASYSTSMAVTQTPTAQCMICPDGFWPSALMWQTGIPTNCANEDYKLLCRRYDKEVWDLVADGQDPFYDRSRGPAMNERVCFPSNNLNPGSDTHCIKSGVELATVPAPDDGGDAFWLVFCIYMKHILCPDSGDSTSTQCFTEKIVAFERAVLKQCWGCQYMQMADKMNFKDIPVLSDANEAGGLCRPVASLA